MAKRPCSVCGTIKVVGSKSRDEIVCQPCRRQRRERTCATCGTTFTSHRAPGSRRVSKGRAYEGGRYCSITCANRRATGSTADSAELKRDRYARKTARRRALLARVEYEHVSPDAVFRRDGWCCYLCGCQLTREGGRYSPAYPTIDHVVPITLGGPHTYANIRAACLRCNSSKGARVA